MAVAPAEYIFKGNTIGDNKILSKKKRGTFYLLAMVMVLSLTACGGKDEPSATSAAPEAPAAPESASEEAAPAAAGGPVPASAVTVFSPQGTPDSPASASLAIDSDPATAWSTDAYFDPFPSLKSGVGLLVTLEDAATLSSAKVTSESPGTVLEIRSAPSDSTSLDQTQVIGQATLGSGETEIPLDADGRTTHVLLWITGLSSDGGSNKSSISEIEFIGSE